MKMKTLLGKVPGKTTNNFVEVNTIIFTDHLNSAKSDYNIHLILQYFSTGVFWKGKWKTNENLISLSEIKNKANLREVCNILK